MSKNWWFGQWPPDGRWIMSWDVAREWPQDLTEQLEIGPDALRIIGVDVSRGPDYTATPPKREYTVTRSTRAMPPKR